MPTREARRTQTGSGAVEAPTPDVLRAALALWAAAERRSVMPTEGWSMWPQLRHGERIQVRHGGETPRLGQVLVVLDGGRAVGHRVVVRRGAGRDVRLRTKGDMNLGLDPGWVDRRDIVGVVEGVLTWGTLRRRAGLDGPAARLLARLSLLVGILAAPIAWAHRRLGGGRRESGPGPASAPGSRGLTPERALLRAAAVQPQTAAPDVLGGLARAPGLDWSALARDASRLGILTLLRAALDRAGVAVPEDFGAACREERVRTAMKILVAEATLRDLLPAFEARGLPCMVLKGLPLAFELYGDPILRPSDDLDVLVRGRDRDAAFAVAAESGFALPPGSFRPAFYRRHHFHIGLIRAREPRIPFELHWDLQPRFSLSRIPEADVWRDARVLNMGGIATTVPRREITFLYLLQHLGRHLVSLDSGAVGDPAGALLEPGRRGRLTWFTDLVLLACGDPPLDRDFVARRAAEWGLQEELAWLLPILREAAPRWRDGAGAGGPGRTAGPAGARTAPGAFRGRTFLRLARAFPRLASASPRLQFRPLLAFRVAAFAFPGAAWIRDRYGLGDAPAARVLARSTAHAAGVLAAAGRLAGATLWEMLRRRR